jgi:hypothetical protein
MARHLALWNKVRALEAELGGRGTRIVITGGLAPPEDAQAPPADSRPEPKPAKSSKDPGSLS